MITLDESYAACRALNREHGTTYYWAAYALPGVKRPHVWALYAFCRYADDIVDAADRGSVEDRRQALDQFATRFFVDLRRGRSEDRILKAVVHTCRAFGLDAEVFERFIASMAMDFDTATYETYEDLRKYMDGSAAVIGEMMLPILEPLDAAATEPARALGEAFQLTNFLRDVGEDLDRGRVYVPQEDLRKFGADPHRRTVDPAWVDLMRFEIDRNRDLYREADRGVPMLPPSSARCIRAARVLYSRILDEIEANGYDVFSQRARVPGWKKAMVVAKAMRGG
jgi:15-cis-phytoene synthase